MIKKHLLLVAILLGLVQPAAAQNVNGNVTDIEDSQAANAGKGSGGGSSLVNVDYFTGTGSVNIPIYAFSTDGLNLGISLGYSLKGIRVDELASSVGLGWSINGPLEINRQLNGLEDEVTLNYHNINSTWDTLEGIWTSGSSDPRAAIIPDDKEHDVFSVNLGGHSVSFAFNYAGDLLTYPRSKIKIERITKDCDFYNLNGDCASFVNTRNGVGSKIGIDHDHDILVFIITDEAGNKFYFERGDYLWKKYNIGQPGFLPDSGVYYPTQKWIIDKIVTASGQEVKYEYVHKYLKYQEGQFEVLNTKPAVIDPNTNTVTYDPMEIHRGMWEGEKYHIKKITYPNGTTVTFNVQSDSTYRCDCRNNYRVVDITVENVQDATNNVKNGFKYVFNYAYFTTPKYSRTAKEEINAPSVCNTIASSLGISIGNETEEYLRLGTRLKLKGITRWNLDVNASEPYYSFSYDTTYALPYRFSPSRDYYGFFNNETPVPYIRPSLVNPSQHDTIYTSIPLHYDSDPNVGISTWGVNRNRSFYPTQAFILNKITNTYGGVTSIDFTDYTLVNPDSAYGYFSVIGYNIDAALEGPSTNDGLCVGKVTNTDKYNVDNTDAIEYVYSGGQRFFRGGYTWYEDPYQHKVYTNNFLAGYKYFNGGNHGFSNVTIIKRGYNNEQLSKSKITFSNLTYYDGSGFHSNLELYTDGPAYHTLPGNFKQYKLGVMLKEETYDQDNYLVKKTENSYEDFIYGAAITNYKSAPYGGGMATYPYTPLDNAMSRITNATTTRYVNDPATQTTKTLTTSYQYSYNNHDQLRTVRWTDSKGETFIKLNLYNYDYEATFGGIAALDSMKNWDREYLLSKEIWKKYSSTDSFLLSLSLLAPVLTADHQNVTYDANFKTITTDEMPVSMSWNPTYIDRAKALDYKNNSSYGLNLIKVNEVTRKDSHSGIIEQELNDKDIYMSYINDLRTGQKIADVSNAKYDDIAYSSFEGDYESFGIADDDKGNWDFDPAYVTYKTNASSASAMTGLYVYELEQSYNFIKSKGLSHKKYILSLWVYAPNGGFLIQRFNSSNTYQGNVSVSEKNAVGDWKLYTGYFTPSAGDYIKISEPNLSQPGDTYIDELRLYPADAAMTTYTYFPMFGTQSTCDPTNYIKYDEYNKFGKRNMIRDMRGNIQIKKESFSDQQDVPDPNNTDPDEDNPNG